MGILVEPYCAALEAGVDGGWGGERVGQFKYERESPDRTVYSGGLIITALYGKVKKIIIVIIIA